MRMFMERKRALRTLRILFIWLMILHDTLALTTIGALHMSVLLYFIKHKQLCKTLADRVHQLQFIENYFATHSTAASNQQQNNQFRSLLSQSPVLLHR